ncbi:unnamed protein product [Acanthoscelides obtectus]|uniref:Uncharacterized protein n=1 Tax=Acanthoscelides obtectus TaxID=200917 RepID=A0A9P0NVA3_ACAOB|nr:unnamed protein product [Acanthoscelides obtectus]CAK1621904.1 hypothetical protein AOBTE_LOCUS1209 [Acanthoscelides obtectus]
MSIYYVSVGICLPSDILRYIGLWAISVPLLRRVTRKCPRTALAGSRLGAMLLFYYLFLHFGIRNRQNGVFY